MSVWLLLVLAASTLQDDYDSLLERLRQEDAGSYEKVRSLDRATALAFLRSRFGGKEGAGKEGAPGAPETKAGAAQRLPARIERFEKIDTLSAGGISIDLCRREDGAFGLGEVRQGGVPLRRADFLITWCVDGRFPSYGRRDGCTVTLVNPDATIVFTPEERTSAGTRFSGFRWRFAAASGPIVETSSWEPGGSTRDLGCFDGYRGWHAPPAWAAAGTLAETNPKLQPSLLHGTGFQMLHRPSASLVHFHTTPGDRLRNASRGEALEFVTTFDGPAAIDRFILTAGAGDRTDLWTRAYEITHAEIRLALKLPRPPREIVIAWPPFSRTGFRETTDECLEETVRHGFTAVYIDALWDNLEFHGGAKNMNVWDYKVCDGYGGEEGLKYLVGECRKRGLKVIPWAPSGHLNDQSPVWKQHPEWLLASHRRTPKVATEPVFGDLSTGFLDHYRKGLLDVVRRFGMDGFWMDSHLMYAQQHASPGHGARLASVYADVIKAGAAHLMAEGDASAFGSYGIGIGDDWIESWGRIPDPELFYGAELMGWFMNPRLHRDHVRRYVAAGAAWTVTWEFLHNAKIAGPDVDEARRETLAVLADYRKVRDRMVHRFVHPDGSGYTWTNDRDASKVVWLLSDAVLQDGRAGKSGQVYVVEPTK